MKMSPSEATELVRALAAHGFRIVAWVPAKQRGTVKMETMDEMDASVHLWSVANIVFPVPPPSVVAPMSQERTENENENM